MIIDDRLGRQTAEKRGIVCTGTLGLLAEAAKLDLVSLPEIFSRLHSTSFRSHPTVVANLLREEAARKAKAQRS